MDDLFAINTAKTAFRECFNLGDASGVLAVADPDLVSFSDGQPSEFGASGLDTLKTRLSIRNKVSTLGTYCASFRISTPR